MDSLVPQFTFSALISNNRIATLFILFFTHLSSPSSFLPPSVNWILLLYEIEEKSLFFSPTMEMQPNGSLDKAKERVFQTFSEFMIRITKFDELAEVGIRLLAGFQQGLDFLRRPSIEKNSGLVERIIRDNETKRLSSYVEAGCLNAHDTLQNMSKLRTCHVGLQDHVNKAKCVVDELACLLKDAEVVVQMMNCSLAQMGERNVDTGTDLSDASHDEEEGLSVDLLKDEVIDIATMMAIVYAMVKNDYAMQEKIVSSLNLTSPSGELESYTSMWSLRPYVDDEIMHKAWKLVRR